MFAKICLNFEYTVYFIQTNVSASSLQKYPATSIFSVQPVALSSSMTWLVSGMLTVP